jgi:hypothetical protein
MKTLPITQEVQNLAIGPGFVSFILNDTVTFQEILPKSVVKADQLQYIYPKDNLLLNSPLEFGETKYLKKYNAAVRSIEVNDKFAKVELEGGKIILHPLEKNHLEENLGGMMFPEESELKITASVLTLSFFIFATSDGKLHIFDLEELCQIQLYNHQVSPIA